MDEVDGRSSTQSYLEAIGRVPLLRAEEERELARRVHQGDAEAKAALAAANARLVVSIAKRYLGLGLPLLDLIQEGNVGLMYATEKFDPEHGTKFATYATWWIRRAIIRGLTQTSRSIRLPESVVTLLREITDAEEAWMDAYGRYPSDRELARHLDLSPKQIRKARHAPQSMMSLDTPLEDDEHTEMTGLIPDNQRPNPDQTALSFLRHEQLERVFRNLTEHEREVLVLRFGLDNGGARTLREAGRELGLSRERIRQIQNEAFDKLRHPQIRGQLEPFFRVSPERASDLPRIRSIG